MGKKLKGKNRLIYAIMTANCQHRHTCTLKLPVQTLEGSRYTSMSLRIQRRGSRKPYSQPLNFFPSVQQSAYFYPFSMISIEPHFRNLLEAWPSKQLNTARTSLKQKFNLKSKSGIIISNQHADF